MVQHSPEMSLTYCQQFRPSPQSGCTKTEWSTTMGQTPLQDTPRDALKWLLPVYKIQTFKYLQGKVQRSTTRMKATSWVQLTLSPLQHPSIDIGGWSQYNWTILISLCWCGSYIITIMFVQDQHYNSVIRQLQCHSLGIFIKLSSGINVRHFQHFLY